MQYEANPSILVTPTAWAVLSVAVFLFLCLTTSGKFRKFAVASLFLLFFALPLLIGTVGLIRVSRMQHAPNVTAFIPSELTVGRGGEQFRFDYRPRQGNLEVTIGNQNGVFTEISPDDSAAGTEAMSALPAQAEDDSFQAIESDSGTTALAMHEDESPAAPSDIAPPAAADPPVPGDSTVPGDPAVPENLPQPGIVDPDAASGEPAAPAPAAADGLPADPPVDNPAPTAGEQDPPEWVTAHAGKLPGNGYRVKLIVGPYVTHEECETAVYPAVQSAITEYLNDNVHPEAGSLLEVPTGFVHNSLIAARYDERISHSFRPNEETPMLQTHVLLDFDTNDDGYLRQLWRNHLVTHRLGLVGIGVAFIGVLVGTLFGYLRLDTATKGYYSGRLKLLSLLIIGGAMFAAGTALHGTSTGLPAGGVTSQARSVANH